MRSHYFALVVSWSGRLLVQVESRDLFVSYGWGSKIHSHIGPSLGTLLRTA